ncbi:dTMP kinase [Methylocystis bryophila]|uniref:Thymidylate kinase n=1 Tax=Methylocystis bryophila TaxID=655015 RepID=A0A1W6N027_9HYPH|nr:dTMP kinase [Methylocystis bryophila]ARN83182.1 dTMP kinase [Methylocystis bryophila]BDV39519.1 thymidylate kinase [Methylocystis bryophila]
MNALGPHAPGRLITFEGGEGAGKSTQIRLLAQALERAGLPVAVTREPGGTPFAERLRELLLDRKTQDLSPLSEALLFAAARIDHVDKVILPALREGAFVLCDRFTDSTRAYQGAMGGADMRLLELLERIALGERQPDLTIILDLPPAEGLARASHRGGGGDRFEARELAYHEGLRRAFLDVARREPIRCRVIDSTRPKAEVAAEILRLVSSRFHAPLLDGLAAR